MGSIIANRWLASQSVKTAVLNPVGRLGKRQRRLGSEYVHRFAYILSADVIFTHRQLKESIVPIARGDYPDAPFDCGV